MSRIWISAGVAMVITAGSTAGAAFLLRHKPVRPGPPAGAGEGGVSALEAAVIALSARVDRVAAALDALPAVPRAVEPAVAAAFPGDVVERLAAIEEALASGRAGGDEPAAVQARAAREARLQDADGYSAADELLAEKQFALAAGAYLRFLEIHPRHPEARDLLRKARDALGSAGYTERAFAVQRRLVAELPDASGDELMTLAKMEKDARRYDEAIQHAGEAAAAANHDEEKVWRLMYRAWYVQLRDGDAAGLQAYDEVRAFAETLGLGDKAPGQKLRVKMAEIEERLAARR